MRKRQFLTQQNTQDYHLRYTIEIRGADEHSQKSMREVYGVASR